MTLNFGVSCAEFAVKYCSSPKCDAILAFSYSSSGRSWGVKYSALRGWKVAAAAAVGRSGRCKGSLVAVVMETPAAQRTLLHPIKDLERENRRAQGGYTTVVAVAEEAGGEGMTIPVQHATRTTSTTTSRQEPITIANVYVCSFAMSNLTRLPLIVSP